MEPFKATSTIKLPGASQYPPLTKVRGFTPQRKASDQTEWDPYQHSCCFRAPYTRGGTKAHIRGANIIPASLDALLERLDEEEQVDVALKASIDMAQEEEAVRVASFIYEELQVFYPLFFIFLCSFLLITNGHFNVRIPVTFVGELLLWEASGSAGIPKEVIEVLDQVLETPIAKEEMGASVPVSGVVSTMKRRSL